MTNKKHWKVGELAKRTGLTVRTLHHYDEIGLVSPSRYSESGHRLYTEEDLSRLQQIMSLKRLGLPLGEIKELIGNPDFNPAEVIRIQLERLDEQIRMQEDLRRRLEQLHLLIRTRQDVDAEQFIQIIEVMRTMDTNQYFTPEQLEKLKKQAEMLGPDRIRAVENEWPELIAKVRAELDKGTPPDSPVVVELAKRWKELVNMFSGGDPEITKAAEQMYKENSDRALQSGIDGALYKYISEAMSHI
ncbi:MerR family transcriptional regulator [Paenibacillus sp. P26]|nr:MerR family transcriptional regulator [Paenibacillus sp. P26]